MRRHGGAKRSAAAADVAKLKVIEASTKQLVEKAGRESIHESDFVNPKVTAGKVRWHSSYEAARKAAEKSGKPVLLFQMMGKLDDQFC